MAFVAVGIFSITQVSADPIVYDYWYDAAAPRGQQATRGQAQQSGRGMDTRQGGNIREEIEDRISGNPARGRQAVNVGQRTAQQGRTAVRTTEVNVAQQAIADGQMPTRATPARGQAQTRGQPAARGQAQPSRAVPTAGTPQARTVQARNASARSAMVPGAMQGRNVQARSGTVARASLQGNPIAAQSGVARSGTNMIGNTVMNIIDESTGGLSAEAYNNCMASYFSCMDEICAARSPGMRRCACSNRVNMYSTLEQELMTRREDLLRLSSQLQLLETTRGGDISAAFILTDAELTLNCVAFREARLRNTATAREAWCDNHNDGNSGATLASGGILDRAACLNLFQGTTGPQYCVRVLGDARGAAALDGADSTIVGQLRDFSDSINTANWLVSENPNQWFANLWGNNALWGPTFNNTSSIERDDCNGNMLQWDTGSSTCKPMTDVLDLWGEQLFNFGHYSVCKRVLDNCFNGICGWSLTNATVTHTGGLVLPSDPAQLSIDQDCWDKQIRLTTGHNLSGVRQQTPVNPNLNQHRYDRGRDQFFALRSPITQARFSIRQKYHFDANADCDVFGEELRRQVQNMNLQMVAAEETLKHRRLEYAEERAQSNAAALTAARSNFHACLDQITSCQLRNECDHRGRNPEGLCHGKNSRQSIRTACSTMTQIPACYQQMVCDRDAGTAGVRVADNASLGVIRNVVTLQEILSGVTGATPGNPQHAVEGCMVLEPMVTDIRCTPMAAPPLVPSVGATSCS